MLSKANSRDGLTVSGKSMFHRIVCKIIFSDHEVEAAKNALLVKLESALSDPVARADNLAVQAAQAGVVNDTSATARTLSKIDAKYLKGLVEKYIYDQDFAMAYYGACEGMPELSQARSRGWDILPKFS